MSLRVSSWFVIWGVGIFAILACSAMGYAQDGEESLPTAEIMVQAISPNDVDVMELETGTSSGLKIVGVGRTVYLKGVGTASTEDGEITVYAWSVSGPRLNMEHSTQMFTFSPPAVGEYKVTLVVTDSSGLESEMAEKTIYAAKWMGIRNCASCHGGQFDNLGNQMTQWKETGHATMLKENLDHGSSHYGENCIECHTVGYDANALNGGFDDAASAAGWVFPATIEEGNWEELVEDYPNAANLANIQCENCHGPGSFHLGDPESIDVSLDAGVCGECHDAPTHHTKNYEWDTSQHAIATAYATGEGRESCVECHSGIGFVQTHDPDYEGEVSTDYSPITCAACHDPHNVDNPHQIRVMEDITLGNGAVVEAEDAGYGALCMNCHKSRRDVNEYVQEYHSHYGPHHGPQADVLKGTGGYEYPGLNYTKRTAHLGPVENSCVGCHMAATPEDAPMGSVGVHSFRMEKVVTAEDGTETTVLNMNACTECHDGLESFNRMADGDYDGDGSVEGIQDEVQGLVSMVGMLLPPMDTEEVEVSEEYTAPQLKAAYNYMLVVEDKSSGIHNPTYLIQLLQSSYHALSGMDVPNADLAIQWTAPTPTPEPTPVVTPSPVPEAAPLAKIDLRAVSERDMELEEIETGVASGLPVVGVGEPVYLMGSGTDPNELEITAYNWEVTGPRYDVTFTEQNPVINPPAEGIYTVSLTVTNADGIESAPAMLEITSAMWEGIRNCASCHNGGFPGLSDQVTPWEGTDHATMLARNLDEGSDHYSENCINCHTVGYNTEANNGGFDDVAQVSGWVFPATIEEGNWAEIVEDYPELANMSNIQCENCHGAGSMHYGDLERIATSLEAGVCAVCHDAGTHHTKDYEWDTSNHANPDPYATGPGRESCVACHSGVGFVQTMDPAYEEVSTEAAAISCSVCHDPHSAENGHQIRVLDDVTLGNGVVAEADEFGYGALCVNCHKSRRDVNEYVQEYHSHYGPHHGPQGDVVKGTGGYEYPGVEYASFSPHLGPLVENTCASCHMAEPPEGAPMGSVGLHTFAMRAEIEGATETVVFENLNACTSCHSGLETLNRQANGDYDGDGMTEGVQDEVHGLLVLLGNLLPPMDSEEVEVAEDYTPEQLKAAYNYFLAEEDSSYGIHNPKYIVQLLQSSYHALAGEDVPGADVTIEWPSVIPTPTLPPVVEPTPSPTPTPTATPKPVEEKETVTVTDNADSEVDLSGSFDRDTTRGRALVIRWDLSNEEDVPVDDVAQVHIYVSVDGQAYTFLGRMGNMNSNMFEWKVRPQRTENYFTALPFIDGPEFGRTYQFRIYALTPSNDKRVHGPFENKEAVTMLPLVTVTDDVVSEVDLSGDQDIDAESEAALAIHWMYDEDSININDLKDVHIYVKRSTDEKPVYLTRTGNGNAGVFVWENGTAMNPDLMSGPQNGESYEFFVFAITESGSPRFYGPLTTLGSVEFIVQ